MVVPSTTRTEIPNPSSPCTSPYYPSCIFPPLKAYLRQRCTSSLIPTAAAATPPPLTPQEEDKEEENPSSSSSPETNPNSTREKKTRKSTRKSRRGQQQQEEEEKGNRIKSQLPRIYGLDEERERLYGILSRTIRYGESNSLIMVGPRGVGKSLLLESCLKQIELEDKEGKEEEEEEAGGGDQEVLKKPFIVVRLNGLLQTDDHIALLEIMRQLCLSQYFEELSDKDSEM
eukprot:Nk52_evm1s793 gene=Nk52_evmTU1s793